MKNTTWDAERTLFISWIFQIVHGERPIRFFFLLNKFQLLDPILRSHFCMMFECTLYIYWQGFNTYWIHCIVFHLIWPLTRRRYKGLPLRHLWLPMIISLITLFQLWIPSVTTRLPAMPWKRYWFTESTDRVHFLTWSVKNCAMRGWVCSPRSLATSEERLQGSPELQHKITWP